jgi:hypothetical protein
MLRSVPPILVFLMLSVLVNAQCDHSISLKRALIEQGENSGLVEVIIKTSDSFVCTIFSESGVGLQRIASQSDQGSKNISFKGLPSDKLYLVQVEFINEKNKFCRKLQKSQITLERQ